jgi:hypothetical protein
MICVEHFSNEDPDFLLFSPSYPTVHVLYSFIMLSVCVISYFETDYLKWIIAQYSVNNCVKQQ